MPYQYRIGTYEISQNAIDKATASGMANVTAGAWSGNQPAAFIGWYEAAAFVNWLNTSSGYQAAYNLTFTTSWSMTLWNNNNAWTLGGTNLYRHKDAHYFLPSEHEWYKAAYYNPAGSSYFLYPTASSTPPTALSSGTNASTAVYLQAIDQGPAEVDIAGGLSPYRTMAQGGNVAEWTETAFDGINNGPSEARALRGGDWNSGTSNLRSSVRGFIGGPSSSGDGFTGFRVASVPEPSTYALLAMSAAGALWWARRRK